MASHATNGESTGFLAKAAGVGQSPVKSSAGSKMGDGMRKAVGNAEEGSQRRGPQPRAWTTNINPITQQPNNSPQTNGTSTFARTTMQRNTGPQDASIPDRNAADRQVWALGNALGLMGTVTAKSGDVFSGVFAGATTEINESTFMFKMVRQLSSHIKDGANGANEAASDYVGTGSDHMMVFGMGDIIDITIANVSTTCSSATQNGAPQGFRTDSDISGGLALRERDLQRWEAPAEHEVDMSQESIGDWDQFAANERFGGKSNYHEDMYTTAIDRSAPLYRMRELQAERKVREIEGDFSANPHVREERGLGLGESGADEEERHSNSTNKYTPPARRPVNNNQNNQSQNVAGGPVDPAIISAQIARPAEPKQRDNLPEPIKIAPSVSQPKLAPSASQAPKESMGSKSSLASAVDQPTKPTRPIAPSKLDTQKAVGVTATENVEVNLLDSFRQFANTEKMRVQDSRRHRQSADKAVKINDLMKFAKNFKLVTPVPSDLVPILAKDKSKQDEIVERARLNAESLIGTSAAGKLSVLADSKSSRPLAPAHWEVEAAAASSNAHNRSTQPTPGSQTSKDRPQVANAPSQPARSQHGLLSHRLADSHRLHKTGTAPMSVPDSLPLQDVRQPPTRPGPSGSGVSSPHGPGGVRSPSSSTSARFNVKATEFKPNPAASTFKPTAEPSLTSSPRTDSNTRSESRAPTPSAFFGDRKLIPVAERPSILSHFNILKHLKDEAENDAAAKNWVSNGGIKPSYKTPPTWTTPTDPEKPEEFKSYKDMFNKARAVPTATPQHSSPVNPALAHQHQLPLHLQNGPQGIPQVQTPHQPSQIHSQAQHYATVPHHYDDHHMRPSVSTSVYPAPSPRMQNNNVAYPSPMNSHAQPAYGQPIPQYMLGPNGPQQAGFRQFPSGPQMMTSPGPHLAPMMVQQPSPGGYMVNPQQMIPFNPQMAMYPGAGPQPFGVAAQSSSGYPSPGRGAPMMMHQGSHQGQPVYMTPSQYSQPIYAQQPPAHMIPMRGNYASPQPHYAQSPYQQHHYPHQAHRTPSTGYAQLPQTHHPHIVSQPVPPPTGPMDLGDDQK